MAELGRRFDAPRNGRRAALLIAFGLAASAIASIAPVVVDVAPAHASAPLDVVAWAPYWQQTASLASISANSAALAEVTPFFYSATAPDTIVDMSGGKLSSFKAAAGAKPVVATITDGMPSGGMAAVLGDDIQRSVHVATLVQFAVDNGLAGIDIDYEKFAFSDAKASWPSTFNSWGLFMHQLSGALHAQGKTLAVAVPPIYNNKQDGTSGYWIYNYPVMGQTVDRIRIMTYSYSGSGLGVVSPYWWVNASMSAALAVPGMDPSKVVMGIADYGNDAITKIDGSCPRGTVLKSRTVTNITAAQTAADKGVTPTFVDKDSSGRLLRESTFSYVESFGGGDANGIPVRCNVSRTVWYASQQAVHQRVLLARDKGIAGVALWALGFDDAATWQAIDAGRSGNTGWSPPGPITPALKAPAVLPPYPAPITSSGPLPARYVDTRIGFKTADRLNQGEGKRPADSVLEVQIGARGPVPGDASAVTLNVTVIGDTPGFVTVYPCGTRPTTSSLNVKPGQAISNTVIAKLSASGSVCIYSQVAVDLVVDVFSVLPDSAIQTLGTPARLLDTRVGEPTSDGLGSGAGAVSGGTFVQVPVAGRGGIRNAAKSAILNVTAVGAAGAGFLTVWPCDSPRPTTSNVNFVRGDAIPNAVITGLSSVGSVCVFASVTTNVVIDVSGELDPDAYQPLDQPARLLDTRAGQTTIDGQFNNIGKRSLNQTTEIAIGGRGGLPSAPSAVVLNVTVDRPELAGFITVYPCGTARPPVSNVNFSPNQTLPNLVVTMLSSTSTVCIYSLVPTDIVIDVFGTLTL